MTPLSFASVMPFTVRVLFSVVAIVSWAWIAVSGKNGGGLSLALESSPVAFSTTTLIAFIQLP